MNDTFMKDKPVFPLLMSMALPMVVSMLVNSLYNIVDSFFVAKISDDAMTALSLVFPVQNLINAVGIGFGVGINAVIAFFKGAGEPDKADRAASQGMFFAIVHSVILTAASIAIMPAFLSMFTSSQNVVNLGVQYSTIAFSFTLVINLGMAAEKIFQAVGKMKISMLALLAGCVTNIILDPLMIFGIGFPEMGIEGAALASGIGQTVLLTVYIVVYLRRPIGVRLRRDCFLPDRHTAARLYSIGIPAALNLALPSLLISALNAILTEFGEVYILTLGIYYKLQTFLYLTANGMIQGMRPLIGYNYGAGEYRRVDQLYRLVLLISAVIMTVGTIICLAIPGELMGLFSNDPQAINAGESALRIISAGFIVSAVSVTSSGALEGLGKGVPSLMISLCRYLVIIVPVAFLLSRWFGPDGVWNAFWVTELLTAAISFIIWRKSISRTKNRNYKKHLTNIDVGCIIHLYGDILRIANQINALRGAFIAVSEAVFFRELPSGARQ